MAERRELADEGRQESLFEAHAPPRPPAPSPWELPPAPPVRDAETTSESSLAPPSDYVVNAARFDEAPAPLFDDVPSPSDDVVEASRDEVVVAPRDEVIEPLRDEVVVAPRDEAVAPAREDAFEATVALATEEVGERRVPRSAGTPLAGPTLDDVMSRVWEGLVTGLPAACPVCHGEVEPALGAPLSGRCRSCGTVID